MLYISQFRCCCCVVVFFFCNAAKRRRKNNFCCEMKKKMKWNQNPPFIILWAVCSNSNNNGGSRFTLLCLADFKCWGNKWNNWWCWKISKEDFFGGKCLHNSPHIKRRERERERARVLELILPTQRRESKISMWNEKLEKQMKNKIESKRTKYKISLECWQWYKKPTMDCFNLPEKYTSFKLKWKDKYMYLCS